MAREEETSAVLLLIGSFFFLTSSVLASLFPGLAFSAGLWQLFYSAPGVQCWFLAGLWAESILSFRAYREVSSRSADPGSAVLPLALALGSGLLCWATGLSIVGLIALLGGAFCAFSFLTMFVDSGQDRCLRESV